ncbi:MAG: complex I subunit 5 family protein [Rhizobiaceae bacterium]
MNADFWAGIPAIELSIAVPLVALLVAIMPGGRVGPRLLLVVAPVMTALAAILVGQVAMQGPMRVALGGWEAPLGIGLFADGLAGSFLMLTAIVMSAVGLVAMRGFNAYKGETAHSYSFWALFYGMWAALNGVFLGADFFNLYVAIELLTITAVGMVALGGTRAAIRYLLFALAGSLAYLTGVVLLYAEAGTLDMALLAQNGGDETVRLVAGALMTAGLLAKTALFPLHAWLPPAHGGAPAPASAMLSALVVKASFIITVRIWFDVMPEAAGPLFVQLMGILGGTAILYGSLLALRQVRLKMVIAYSTVAQLGYLFFIFPLSGGLAGEMPWAAGAWSGGMFHALSHGVAKAAAFLAAGLIIEALGHDRIDGMKGMARAMPVTVFAFGIAAISLMGLPPSGGFMAKYLMLTAALAGGHVVIALVIMVGGLLAAAYLFRPLNRAFSGSEVPEIAPVAYWRQWVPLILALLSVLLGVVSAGPYEFLQIGRPVTAEIGIE